MPIDTSIFKAYDIRGLSPGQLDEDTAYRIGQALVKYTNAKTVLLGKDMRETTPALSDALAKGVMSLGANVVDIGLVTTPMYYYALCALKDADAGAMVTASHNPQEYNGMKLCFADSLPISGTTGLPDLRDLAVAGPYDPVPEPGSRSERDIRAGYLDSLFEELDMGAFKPMKVMADTANGMEGVIIDDLLARVPELESEVLFKELDGSFPNHEANPLKYETLAALQERVRESGANFGVAFDGDGDRIGFVDETGEPVRGDLLLALLAPLMLEDSPGDTVLYDVRQSMAVPEEIERAGGKPGMCRVGHGVIKPQMREENAVFAGELSNHYYFRKYCGAESSDLVLLMVMQLLAESGKKLSELIAPLNRYHHSGEINSEVGDKDAVLAALEEKYGAAASNVIRIDGVRMEFFDPERSDEDWFFSVRASNTEPKLRLNLEAKNKAKMEQMRDELLALIRG